MIILICKALAEVENVRARYLMTVLLGVVFWSAVGCPGSLFADALATPPRFVRANRVTAGVASAARTLDFTLGAGTIPSPATYRCQSVVIENESATDDAYVNFNSATAAATDGANSLNVRIRAGKTLSIDVRTDQISFIRAAAVDVTLNIVSVY